MGFLPTGLVRTFHAQTSINIYIIWECPVVSTSTENEPSRLYLNRELSWVAFNGRVLAQAEDESLPLLDRLKFCAIYAGNLDEFFMVRVAGLKDQVAAGVTKAPPDGLSPLAQLQAIGEKVVDQGERLQAVLHDDLLPELAHEGVVIASWDQLAPADRKRASAEFHDRVFPILTPLAVDPGHPFPYISSLSLNVAVLVHDPDSDQNRFARVKVPPSLPRFLRLPDDRFVPLEEVIIAHLDQLFYGMDVIGGWAFRVTRNADLTLDQDAEDLLEAVEMELRRRRFGRAIRLEVRNDTPTEVLNLLQRELDLEDEDVFFFKGHLDATSYWELQSLDRSDLMTPLTTGVTPRRLRDVEDSRDLFERLRRSDIMVHHPYDSFSASVTEFIRQASQDSSVLAIKITLYRTSGDSPIIDALVRAAESGKQVAALVELKARFDEQANIQWARRLEEAGVHVVYGLVGLKIHTKTTLVVRDEPDGVRRYCHIGTGNYNPKTARIYEDVGVLTADPTVGNDLTQLFNYLTGYGRDLSYQRLLVAPNTMRTSLEQLIINEIDCHVDYLNRREVVHSADSNSDPRPGRIILKMNSLVDRMLIDLLYLASDAGVRIDLIVRGICCLVPGVKGMSENISVKSLVGQNLEHSRIYYFANGAAVEDLEGDVVVAAETESLVGDKGRADRFYIGSADLMPRNLDRRVEALLRVDDPTSKSRLHEILKVNLDDGELSWILQSDGTYLRSNGQSNAHKVFEELALSRSAPAESPVVPTGVSKANQLLRKLSLPRLRS